MTQQIPLTRGKFAIVDDDDFEYLSQYKWYCDSYGYAGRLKSIKMHRVIMGNPDGLEIDHANRNTLDNRKENLRICTRSQNGANRPARGKNGLKGVRWHERDRRWEAYISVCGKKEYLGGFENRDDAARAYDVAAKRVYGEFSLINFPQDGEL